MIYALDPLIHHVWRTPTVLQFGVEQSVLTLTDLSNAEERMLVALEAGVTLSGLQLVAARAGGTNDDAAHLLQRVESVLAGDAPSPSPASPPLVVLDGAGPTATRLVRILSESGLDVRTGLSWNDPAIESTHVAVIVGAFAIEPERHQRWLRRDIPHLPIVFGDRSAMIGPLVEPGSGPCAGCVERHRADADPDWPAMASQLCTRPVRHETSLVSSMVASAAAWALVARVRSGSGRLSTASLAVDYETGFTTEREHRPHEDCGCRALPGSGKADVLRPGRPDFPPATS